MVTPMPGTMLTKNSQCQEKASVRYPPTVGPIVGASVATRPISGEMNPSLERGKIVNAVANTVGIMPPPMKPCTACQKIISLIEDESPHIRLAAVKPAAEA